MQVSDIDWENWTPEIRATLMFVLRGDEVLLIRKKTGLGAGKINGPGGKLEADESPLQCAIRETEEELCITPRRIRNHGELFFHSDDFPKIHAHVFVSHEHEGKPTETREALPMWTPVADIPFNEMWEDDQFWLPEVLSGHHVQGHFIFTGETLLDHRLKMTPPGQW